MLCVGQSALHAKIEERDWAALHVGDQLLQQKKNGESGPFPSFHEAPLLFPPTYKYQPGTDKYEKREDKKKRLPAWCDRIQWTGEGVECEVYDRAELNTSDHKPVFGLYRMQAKVVVADKLEAVRAELVQQLLAELDERENEAMPKVDISPTTVHFGRVLFDSELRRSCTVTNTGASVAQWAFKQMRNSAGVHKPWLTVAPPFGLIPVGESQVITITIHVTSETSQALMTGEDVLEDVLFLGLENGSAAFITVSGEYRRSAFGCSVEYLVNQPQPVRFSTPGGGMAGGGGKGGFSAGQAPLSLPKEIWRLVDYLYTRAMDAPDLFLTNGVQTEVESIIDAVDTGADFAVYNVHSVAECFVYLLKQMPQPIFPTSLVDEFNDGGDRKLAPERLKEFCRAALQRLPPASYNAFVYLIAFLRELLLHKEKNKLHPVQLTLVFASALFHYNLDDSDPTLGLRPDQNKPKAWQILRYYLISPTFP